MQVAGGILPYQKKRNVESRLPVFDHPDIKLDSKNRKPSKRSLDKTTGTQEKI